MELISSCYWQQKENTSAILVQELDCCKTTVFFAFVCAGGEGQEMAAEYLSGQFREWFRGVPWKRAVGNVEHSLKRCAVKLERLVRRTDRELKAGRLLEGQKTAYEASAPGFAGILCIGRECLLFARGNAGIYLLNRSMGRPCMERIAGGISDGILDKISDSASSDRLPHGLTNGFPYGTQFGIQRAALEPGLGLLFATDSFTEGLSEEVLREGLSSCEVCKERQAEKRLRELGEAAEAAGGRNLAAVLLFTAEEG